MKRIKYILLAGLLVFGCSKEKGSGEAEITSEQNAENQSVSLTPEQIATINLKIGHLEKRSLSNTIQANGYLDVPPQNKAVISPMITGFVRKLNFLVGDNIKKGAVMAELESMEFIDMQQKYIELKSKLVFLEDDYKRQKLLKDQDAVSKKKYLMAEVEYNTAVTTLHGIQSKLELLGLNMKQLDQGEIKSRFVLRAPISGSVKNLNVTMGQHVDSSEKIYEIVNTEHLHVELSVFEKDVIKVKKGQHVRCKVSGIDNEEFTGKVFLVGKDLSEDKRSINVHVHLDEEEGPFTVGMYVNAYISIGENDSYTLPSEALVVEGNKKYIFVKKEDQSENISFYRKAVQTGFETENFVEITSMDALSASDEIVINGAFYLLNSFAEE